MTSPATKRPPMPSEWQVDAAVAWLRCNEGPMGESDACRITADWIDYIAHEDFLRRQARLAGVPVARLRRKLAEQERAAS